MALDEPKEDETTIQINGLDVLMSEFDARIMDGISLDYVKDMNSEGFVVSGASGC